MNTTTPAASCKYSVDQAVEVQVTDFTTPGMPFIWVAATVTVVEAFDNGLFDVMAVTAAGAYAPHIVGKRGGSKRIRASVSC